MNALESVQATSRFELSKPPVWLGFAWGFAEATLFFVVPDMIITLAVLSSFRLAMKHLAAVLAGSIIGGMFMFFAACIHPTLVNNVVLSIPFVRPAMFETVRADLATHGVWGLCLGPLSGIPYKVYAVLAPAYVASASFALVSVPARLERLLVSLALFAVIGWILRKIWPQRAYLGVGVYGVYWLVVYGYYWSKI